MVDSKDNEAINLRMIETRESSRDEKKKRPESILYETASQVNTSKRRAQAGPNR